MKFLLSLYLVTGIFFCTYGKEAVYTGSTPVHATVREFLDISRTDSMDFMRWTLAIDGNKYELKCNYGLSKPNTPGFSNGKWVEFSGMLTKDQYYYTLTHGAKTFYLLIINSNLLHLLDKQKKYLVGNGGYSYVLNNMRPVTFAAFQTPAKPAPPNAVMAFEGRTPCQELSRLTGSNKGPACNKLKWFIIFYTDAATGKPAYYLEGGRQYRPETMNKGNWEIITQKDGRVFYRLDPEKKRQAINLLRASENILLFTDPDGNLLIGDEDFSYSLNRSLEREASFRKK